jgi:hypothetical protein
MPEQQRLAPMKHDVYLVEVMNQGMFVYPHGRTPGRRFG